MAYGRRLAMFVSLLEPCSFAMKFTAIPLALFLSGACIAQTAYIPYVNQRFTFAFEYPNQILLPRGESDDGDGQIFETKEGDAKLTVFGRWRSEGFDFPCEALETVASYAGENITYKWKKGGASVVSGITSDREIFYVKNVRSSDKCVTLIFEYPEARRKAFDPLVSHIANSLRSRR